jgi:GntR family transcriptional regulator/MocR family aminotransferase
VDLHLPVGSRPGRAELEQALRDGVRAGRLRAGTPLPSSRTLAAELGISRGVVVEAYAQLAAEGWLSARQGAGTTVAATGWDPAGSRRDALDPGAPAEPALRYDLRTGRPDLSAFPRRAWGAALAAAVRTLPDAGLDYGDPRGVPALRTALAGHLGRARGVVADPARVVVCPGTAGGLPLVWQALRERGARRVGVEDPGWREQAASARLAGLDPVPIPVDARGLDVDALRAADVDAVAVTPAHQFPTGVVLAAERRAALLAWARDTGGIVVEDDYDAEYRYDREPVGALQGLAPEHVVYAGSASKTLAPALRLGWLVLPADLAGPVAARTARGSSAFDQLALASLIETGHLDRHLRRTRRSYRSRRDALVDALGGRVAITGVAAGLHLVARTDDAAAIAARARTRGVAVQTLHEDCTTHRPQEPALLLGYARESEPALRRAAELLLA